MSDVKQISGEDAKEVLVYLYTTLLDSMNHLLAGLSKCTPGTRAHLEYCRALAGAAENLASSVAWFFDGDEEESALTLEPKDKL